MRELFSNGDYRANDAGWQIWQEKQQRVSIVGMIFFRTLNICCSCILFSQIMTYCQPQSPDGETTLSSISFSSVWNIFIPIRQCTAEGYLDFYSHIYQRTKIPMRLNIICKVSDGGKRILLSLSMRAMWCRTGFKPGSMVSEEPSKLNQKQTLRIDVF